MANRKLKCRYCNDYFDREVMLKINGGNYCSMSHAIKYGKEKGLKNRKSIDRKETRKAKERIKSYATKMTELQKVFNELRRHEEFLWFKEKGIEPYCISCLKPLGNDQWCNGHYKTTKARPDLRFDKMNSYLQHNMRCNQMLSGDIENYKLGLAYRFGEEKAKEILDYCEEQKESVRYSDEEIYKLKKQWRKEIREIKKKLDQ